MRIKYTVQFDKQAKKWIVIHSADEHTTVARNLNKKAAIHQAVEMSQKLVPVVVTKKDGTLDYVLFAEKGFKRVVVWVRPEEMGPIRAVALKLRKKWENENDGES